MVWAMPESDVLAFPTALKVFREWRHHEVRRD